MTAAASARSGRDRYSAVAIVLHWIIALAIIAQIFLPGRMEGPPTPELFAVTQLHKSIGITILLLSLARLGWRLLNPPPPEPLTLAPWERVLSQTVHWGFYAFMIFMPLTGWLMVSASRIEIPTLLYGVVHWPDFPGIHDLAPAAKKTWRTIGCNGHGLLAKLIWGLLALHVAGVLKHQLLSRNEPILARMAPGAIPGRWLEPRLFLIAAAFLGAVAFGMFVQPPRPAMGPAPAAAAPAEPAATPVAAPAPAAAAVEAPAPAATPAPATGATPWKVAPGSKLTFASSWGGDPIQGRFDKWRADVLFGPDALDKSKVTVSIDMTSAKTGDEQRDASLPSGDWFDAAAHPKATFTATKFEKTGADRYVAHGALSLRGVTRPLDLPFRLTITGDKAHVTGEAGLDRTVFGVGQGEFTATDQIPGKVTVRVDLTATRDQR